MVLVGGGEKIGWSRDCDTGTKGGDGGCDSDGSCGGSCSTRGRCGNDGGDGYSGGVYPSYGFVCDRVDLHYDSNVSAG